MNWRPSIFPHYFFGLDIQQKYLATAQHHPWLHAVTIIVCEAYLYILMLLVSELVSFISAKCNIND